MEDVYPREAETNIAEVYLREVGAGRVAYFPGRHRQHVLEDARSRPRTDSRERGRWALNEPDVVSVRGQGVLDVSAWEGEDYLAVHLVNLTNPMMMKGPLRETISTGPQQLSVQTSARKVTTPTTPPSEPSASREPTLAEQRSASPSPHRRPRSPRNRVLTRPSLQIEGYDCKVGGGLRRTKIPLLGAGSKSLFVRWPSWSVAGSKSAPLRQTRAWTLGSIRP